MRSLPFSLFQAKEINNIPIYRNRTEYYRMHSTYCKRNVKKIIYQSMKTQWNAYNYIHIPFETYELIHDCTLIQKINDLMPLVRPFEYICKFLEWIRNKVTILILWNFTLSIHLNFFCFMWICSMSNTSQHTLCAHLLYGDT